MAKDLLEMLEEEKVKASGKNREILMQTIKDIKKNTKPVLEDEVERGGFKFKYAKGKGPK